MNLVIVADDFGADAASDRAIVDVVERGGITHVTTLATNSLSNYKDTTSGVKMFWGAHLFLTEFEPLTSNLKKICGCRPLAKRELVWNLASMGITEGDIYCEFEAQFNAIISKGYPLSFLDTHMNIHWMPKVFRAVQRLAEKHGLGSNVRPIAQLDFSLNGNWRTFLSLLCAKAFNFKMDSRVVINCPGYKSDSLDIQKSLGSWQDFLEAVRFNGYGEIVVPCHPGISPAEVQLYATPEFKALIRKYTQIKVSLV